MSEEQIKIWREEAMRLFSDSYLSSENITPISYLKGYLEARKKAQEEIDKLKKVSGSLSGTRIKGDRK